MSLGVHFRAAVHYSTKEILSDTVPPQIHNDVMLEVKEKQSRSGQIALIYFNFPSYLLMVLG